MTGVDMGTRDRMKAAVRKITPPERLASSEYFIETAIHALLIEGGNGRRARRPINNKKVASELAKVAKAVDRLTQSLENLHPTSAHRFRDVITLVNQIKIIGLIARAPFDATEFAPSMRQLDDNPISPTLSLAVKTAYVFSQMTGKNPTVSKCEQSDTVHTSVSGEFPDFLRDVFSIRGIKASIETHAELARDILKNRSAASFNTQTIPQGS